MHDQDAIDYCAQYLRRHDPDLYLLSLFSQSSSLPSLWALYSFAHEIAKTREVVTETRLGLIRLQWWRDAIGAIYDQKAVPDHPVLRLLNKAVTEYKLPRDLLEGMIYAHEFDLEDQVPTTTEGLIHYADFTTTPLLRLAARIDGRAEDIDPLRATAIVFCLVRLLMNIPAHALQNRCYLPMDRLSLAGIDPYDIYDGSAAKKIKPVVMGLLDVLQEHAKKAGVFKEHKHLSLLYIKKIKNAQGDVFSKDVQSPIAFKELKIFIAKFFDRK